MLAIIEAIENDEDRALVEQIYYEHTDFIMWTICEYVFRKNSYEDLLQETFVHIIRNLDVIKGLEEYKIKPYIKILTRNVCMDYLRKFQRTEINDVQFEDEHKGNYNKRDYNPEKIFANKELLEKVWTNVGKLSDRDREIFLSRYAYNMSYKEIALEMGLPDKSVNQLVKRAKERLKRLIQEEV